MITKDLLKKEIDLVREEYLIALYQIIKTFERPYDRKRTTWRNRNFPPTKLA